MRHTSPIATSRAYRHIDPLGDGRLVRHRRLAARGLAGGAIVLGLTITLAGCGAADSTSSTSGAPGETSSQAAIATPPSPAYDPNAPTGWGPTVGELDEARALVATWTPAQLAGQVIVGRWQGTDPATAASLVSDLHLSGVQLTGGNIVDEAQVRATNQAVTEAFAASGRDFPPIIGVDQEGGQVAHLSGVTTDLPAFASAGTAASTGQEGTASVRAAMAAAATELRGLGFTWIFAPVADVTIGSADPTIGSRSPSSDPQVAATTSVAAIQGYNDAAIASTVKHFPGHGSATEDSHKTLPVLTASMAELQTRDLPPFVASFEAGAPAVMVGHLDVAAIAPGVPTSLAPQTYQLLRNDLGFQGVAITDSLGMGGVMSRPSPSVDALAAGADLLLMPADTRVAHAQVTQAIESGTVPRARAEEAAARVVALQHWQQRAAATAPVPPDAAAQTAARVQEMLAYSW